VKIRAVTHNNRKKAFEVRSSTKSLTFPFSNAEPTPTMQDPIAELFVDAELPTSEICFSTG
jgi:hypothetical protein